MSKKSAKPPNKKSNEATRLQLAAKEPGSYYVERITAVQEQLIGQGIVSWSKLEMVLEETIWRVLKLDVPTGRTITARLDAKHKFQLFRGLVEIYFTEGAMDSALKLLNEIEKVYNFRNSLAHGAWVTVMPKDTPASLSLREKPHDSSDVVASEMPPELMKNNILHTKQLTNLLIRLRDSVGEPPQLPSPPAAKVI